MKVSIIKHFLPLFLVGGGAIAAPPLWWAGNSPPVVDSTKNSNHFAPANIGQAKWMAKNALEALCQVDPVMAGAVEADLVGEGKPVMSWNAPVATGRSVGGAFHSKKGTDAIRSLDRWLNNNPTASPGNRAAAENIILDLRNALGQ